MRKLLSIIFFTMISLNGIAQIADTIKISSGKQYVFLINIAEYPTQIVGDNLESEKIELQKNFKAQNLKIILIKKHCFLKLESGQGLDMTNFKKTFTATAYWSGNKQDEVELFDRIVNTTEFIAEKTGIKKQSSYAMNADSDNKIVKQLLSKNNITQNSKITLNKFLQSYQNYPLTLNEEYWYLQDIPKIKTIKMFVSENGKDKIYKNLEFNSSGQIEEETEYNSKSKPSSKRKYIYESGMLTAIEKSDTTTSIKYDDKKMIFSENIGDANETTIYWIENNNLLSKKYVLMIDQQYANQNMITEEKMEKNCIVKYLNGEIIEKNCASPYGTFPYTNTYTSYQSAAADQGSDYMQLLKYKIEKKGAKVFEKYYSDKQKPNEKDNYELNNTFYLNENNLISKISNRKNTLKIEYVYYP